MRLGQVVVVSLFAGCSGNRTYGDGPHFGDEPTDTFPQFLGRPPKNIVMISMDTFRKDRLGRYGGSTVAPFLSAMADAGVVADRHFQCSNWTFASTSCTLAGRHNEEAGMVPNLSDSLAVPWPAGTPFLATYLREAGFYSILVSSNGWLAPEWNNTDGYDEATLAGTGLAWGVYEQARERLDEAMDEGRADRWLLHVHFVEPHAAYDPPDEYITEEADLPPVPWDLADRDQHYEARDEWPAMSPEDQELLAEHLRIRYDGELSYLDDQVFRIFVDLQRDGLLDDALLVFWTDHGEQFWEHGNQTHAYALTGEEADGLLFFWSPNIVTAAWSEPTSAIDLVPTLLDVYGVPIPPEVTGVPLGQATPDRPVFAATVARLGAAQSVQKNGWKLSFSYFGDLNLYDRNTDPLETTDLYDPAAPSAEALELWADLEPQIEKMEPLVPQYRVDWPDELPH